MKELGYYERKKMSTEELVDYYLKKRSYDFEHNIPIPLEEIEKRKKRYLAVKTVLKADQIMRRNRIKVISDKRNKKTHGNRIYACTHIGGYDIERSLQVINESAWLMLGNPGHLYKELAYALLEFNGVITLETHDVQDRKIAQRRSAELGNKGGTELMFPEGAYNVLPNCVVMKLFVGVVKTARETGQYIVPMAIELIGNTYYFNIGEEYQISKDCELTDRELADNLRDTLATLKWEILEKQPITKRESINMTVREFQEGIMSRNNYGFPLEDAFADMYHDKNITEYEEAFKFIEDLDFSKNNSLKTGLYADIVKTLVKR